MLHFSFSFSNIRLQLLSDKHKFSNNKNLSLDSYFQTKRQRKKTIWILEFLRSRNKMELTKLCSLNLTREGSISTSWRDYLKMLGEKSSRTHNWRPKTQVNLQVLILQLSLSQVVWTFLL